MTEKNGLRISGIKRTLIKGTMSESLATTLVGRRGIHLDHEWVVVDEGGMFVAQRSADGMGVGIKSICLVRAVVANDGDGTKEYVKVTAPKMDHLVFPINPRNDHRSEVQVWDWHGPAIEVAPAASAWFSDYLSRERPGKYRLMRMAREAVRKSKTGEAEMAFQDAFPFMVISRASHDAVNANIEGDLVDIDRWRASFVIEGCDAFEEDLLDGFVAGDVTFHGQKLCDRCAAPGYNQADASIDTRPLGALPKLGRKWKDDKGRLKVWLGRNFTHDGKAGRISVGDAVEQSLAA